MLSISVTLVTSLMNMLNNGPHSQLHIMHVCALVHPEQHVHFPPLLVHPLANLPFTPFARNVGHAHGLPTRYSASVPHHEKQNKARLFLETATSANCMRNEYSTKSKINGGWVGGGSPGTNEKETQHQSQLSIE